MEKMSDVRYVREHLRRRIEEVDSMTMLAKSCGTNRYTLNKVLAGKDLRLKTVDVLAIGCGKTVAEMFLEPGVKTDWYREASLEYLPDNLRDAMSDRGLEMRDLEAESGVKWQQVESYLMRETMPMAKTLQKIADALEMEVADLFLPLEGSEGHGIDH